MNKGYKTIYKSFLGSLTKKGKKQLIKTVLDKALLKVSSELKLPVDLLLTKLFLNLSCFVESKVINVRKNSYVIPFPLRSKRQNFLKIKWIIQSVNSVNTSASFSDKLAIEIINIIKNIPSRSLSFRNDNIKESLSNRSNLHFRW